MGRYEEWKEKTKELRKIFGKNRQPDPTLDTVAEVAPFFGEVARVTLMGAFYANPKVDLKTRSLCTVAALTVLVRPPLLKGWIRNALNAGCTKEEIIEIISQMAFYGGVPSAVMAFNTAKEAFAEHGV